MIQAILWVSVWLKATVETEDCVEKRDHKGETSLEVMTETVELSDKFDDMGMMRQPVEQGSLLFDRQYPPLIFHMRLP